MAFNDGATGFFQHQGGLFGPTVGRIDGVLHTSISDETFDQYMKNLDKIIDTILHFSVRNLIYDITPSKQRLIVLCETISKMKNLKVLSLRYTFNNEDDDRLITLLRELPTLENLELVCKPNDVDEDTEEVSKEGNGLAHLKAITLTGLNLGTVKKILKVVNPNTLAHFNITDTKNLEQVAKFTESVLRRHQSTLKYVNVRIVSPNQLSILPPDVIRLLFEAMAQCQKMLNVELNGFGIDCSDIHVGKIVSKEMSKSLNEHPPGIALRTEPKFPNEMIRFYDIFTLDGNDIRLVLCLFDHLYEVEYYERLQSKEGRAVTALLIAKKDRFGDLDVLRLVNVMLLGPGKGKDVDESESEEE